MNYKTCKTTVANLSDKKWQITEIHRLQKTKLYVDRLANYLDQWRTHVLSEIGTGVSKCRPLWDILEGFRHLLCAHILGPFVCIIKKE